MGFSCLQIYVSKVGHPMSVVAVRIDTALVVLSSRTCDDVFVSATKISDGASVVASRIGDGIKASAHLVCSTNKSAYLNVAPDHVWLTPDMLSSAEFEITANVSWTIV